MTNGQWLVVVALAFVWGWLTADWRRDSLELAINSAAQVAVTSPKRRCWRLPANPPGGWKISWRRWKVADRRRSEQKFLSRFSLMFACLMILSGCITQPSKIPSVPYQENLKRKCPTENLPRIKGNTGADIAAPAIEYQDLYSVCAARHNALIDEINKRESVLNGTEN